MPSKRAHSPKFASGENTFIFKHKHAENATTPQKCEEHLFSISLLLQYPALPMGTVVKQQKQ